MRFGYAYAAVIFVLAACSSLKEQGEQLVQTQKCCLRPSEFNFIQLSRDPSKETILDENSSSYAFPQGKSYFAAYRLPREAQASTLRVRTYPSLLSVRSPLAAGYSRYEYQLFCPAVTYLDSEREPIATFDLPLSLSYVRPGGFADVYWVAATGIPPAARFVVVHTASNSIGRPITPSSPTSKYAFLTGNQPKNELRETVCGQLGRLMVEVQQSK